VVDTVMALTGKLLGIDDPAGLVVLLLVVALSLWPGAGATR